MPSALSSPPARRSAPPAGASTGDAVDAPERASRGTVLATEALLLVMAVIWGFNYIVVKFGAEQLGPITFNSVRVAIAAVLLLVLAQLTVKHAWPSRRDTLALLAIGVLGNCIYQLFFIEGIARTQPGTASLVLASGPALIALVGRVMGVERVGRRGMLGIAASIAGVALVMFGSGVSGSAAGSLVGNALCFAGAICWALFTVLLKPYTDRVNGLQLSAITMVGGAIPLLVISAPGIVAAPWATLSGTAYAAIVYASVLALVVAYSIYYRGVRVIGPTRTSMFGNVQPFVALLAGWAVYHDVPTAVQAAGAIGIMAGVLLTRSDA